jgi:hypothetical protein
MISSAGLYFEYLLLYRISGRQTSTRTDTVAYWQCNEVAVCLHYAYYLWSNTVMQGKERSDEKESAACGITAAAYHVPAVATAQEHSPCLALIISTWI